MGSKARNLADFVSTGNPLADNVISVSEVDGAAPLANPSFTGSVGIGEASPAQILHVNNNDAASARIRIENSEGSVDVGTDGTDMFFVAGGSERMRVESDGHVGIGTVSPQYPLDVIGTLRIQYSGTDTFATIRGPSNRDLHIDLDANDDNDNFIIRDLRDNSERFVVTSGGNVGIGISSPSTALHVSGTVTATAFTGDGSALTGTGGGLFKGENGEVGSSAGDIFRVNEQTLNTSVTIDADENASATGPLSIASGVTLTVTSGGNLTIV